MSAIVIPDVEEATLTRLRERAAAHGRSPEDEARLILLDALGGNPAANAWDAARAILDRLAATGRAFGDSAELVREDRER